MAWISPSCDCSSHQTPSDALSPIQPQIDEGAAGEFDVDIEDEDGDDEDGGDEEYEDELDDGDAGEEGLSVDEEAEDDIDDSPL